MPGADSSPSPARPVSRRFRWACAGVFGLALLARLGNLWLLTDSPLSHVLMGDARRYQEWGAEIAQGDWLGKESFYQAPLYPYFIGGLYWIFGIDQMTVRIAQAVMGAASCLFLAYAGKRMFSPRTGLVAGLAFALYPPAIFFDGILQKTSLGSFLTCAILAVMARAAYRPRGVWVWGLLGMLLGALMLTRENALVLITILPVWLAFGWGRVAYRARLGWLTLVLLGMAAVLFPVAVRNRYVGGEWHLTTSQFGPNFYIGNSEYANGRYIPLKQDRGSPEFERIDATEIAEKAEGRELSPGEVSAYWTQAALADIKADWPRWYRLMLRKWFLIWNATEIIDTEDIYSHADASWLLRGLLPVWHLGVLAPLAFLGMTLAWRSWRRHGVLVFFILAYAASVSLFYVFARYRFPLVAPLMLFAAAGLIRLPKVLRCRRFAWPAVGFAGLAAAAWFTNLPGEPRDPMRSNTHYMLAINWERDGGKEDDIRRELELAEAYDPKYAEVFRWRANFELRSGNKETALQYYRQCLELDEGFLSARYDYGVVLFGRREFQAAIEQFQPIDNWEPEFADGWLQYLLGTSYFYSREFSRAEFHLKEALKLGRSEAAVYFHLGRSLMSLNRYRAAVKPFQEGLAIEPANRLAKALLGDCFQKLGQPAEAVAYWQRALSDLPPTSQQARRLQQKIRQHSRWGQIRPAGGRSGQNPLKPAARSR